VGTGWRRPNYENTEEQKEAEERFGGHATELSLIFRLIQTSFGSKWQRWLAGAGHSQPKTNQNIMKKFLTIAAVIAFGSAAHAGCGKIETTEGTLKSFDKETKTLKVEGKDAKVASITLTPTTKGADLVDGLVGKSVKVDATHGKATVVAAK
jgi:hypothetical protein